MKKDLSANSILGYVSAAHFLVDFACIFLVMAVLPAKHWVFFALLYNFCAFALQFPVGLVADLFSTHLRFSSRGCLLIALSFLLVTISPMIACVFAGVGNAMFHIGGGVTVMHSFPKKMTPLGIFVSPGALGVFLAMASVPLRDVFFLICPIVMLAAAVWFFLLDKEESPRELRPGFALKRVQLMSGIAILLLFLAVVFRSYFGLILVFPWKNGFILPFLFVIGVATGKALGGFLGDRIGLIPAALGTLFLSALLFLFASWSPLCGILGVLFFNMTMPLTLFALGEILGDAKGCAFGLTTFALFLGTLPTLLPVLALGGNLVVMIVLITLSALCIAFGAALGLGGNNE
ncbi:MAG: hypothetical protein IIY02_05585 [Firmicutes bacterium]|nr:hypothetical protein [Bacillota bacterium]